MVGFVVLASGGGTNFQALIDGIREGEITGVELLALITDNPLAAAIQRANAAKIPVHVVKRSDYQSRGEMDLAVKQIADLYKPDYLFLLGYMRLIEARELFEGYKNRMVNLHPAILPSFPGLDAQKQALEYGCKISGVTIHFLNEGVDTGPILYQKAESIESCKSPEEVHDRLRPLEHEGVKKIAQMLAKGKFVVEGRRARYVPY